ncbi:hypothetical protein ACFLUB_02490 [Chloroflexota bacterium]
MDKQTNLKVTENETFAEEELIRNKVDKDGQCWINLQKPLLNDEIPA